MKCPTCQQNVLTIFKCDFCSDMRCNATFSNGNKGACGTQKSPFGKAQSASEGKTCYVCQKGKYKKV